MKIIIDGYNLLHQYYTGFPPHDAQARDALIESLSKYKRVKRADITVIFDGIEGISQAANSYMERGIKLIFTARGISADDEICKRVKGKAEGVIVISSDRSVK